MPHTDTPCFRDLIFRDRMLRGHAGHFELQITPQTTRAESAEIAAL